MQERQNQDIPEENYKPQGNENGGSSEGSEEDAPYEGGLRFDPDSDVGVPRAEESNEAPEAPRQQQPEQRRDYGRERGRDSRGRGRGRGPAQNTGNNQQQVEEIGAASGIDVLEPRRNRRPGAPTAGLSLGDLLPFLRPPRTVLLLGATTGCGHGRVASALAEAFRGLDRNLIVREADMLDLLDNERSASEVRYELDEIGRHADLYGTPFSDGPAPEGPDAAERVNGLCKKLFADRFDHSVVEKRPDHVVLTHWLALGRLAELKEAGRLSAAVTLVIPEPDVHSFWISPVVSHYIVANDYVKARLLRRGVADDDVTVCGVPVSPAFVGLPDRDRQRAALGLRGAVVALRTEGTGGGAKTMKFARGLVERHGHTCFVFAVARGEAIAQELSALDGVNGCAVRVAEGPEAFRDIIAAVDLIVSRANLHAAAEAMAAGVPMLLLRPASGTEDRMADRLLARGVAVKATCTEDLEDLLGELLRNRRALQQMQDTAQQGRKPTAAQEAVDRIARLVR